MSSAVFCQCSFWLPSDPHCPSNLKRILLYKSFESDLAHTDVASQTAAACADKIRQTM